MLINRVIKCSGKKFPVEIELDVIAVMMCSSKCLILDGRQSLPRIMGQILLSVMTSKLLSLVITASGAHSAK